MTSAISNCSKYSIAIFKSEITSWLLLPQSYNLPIFKTYIGCVVITFRYPFFWLTLYTTFDFRPAVAADADHDIAARATDDKNTLATVLAKFDTH